MAQGLGLGLSLHMLYTRLSLGRKTLLTTLIRYCIYRPYALIYTVAGRGRIIEDKFYDNICTPVRDIMTSDVLTVAPDQSIEDCMKIMSEYHIRHLPVAENGNPIGMLSVMDVVKSIISEKDILIDQLEHYISG